MDLTAAAAAAAADAATMTTSGEYRCTGYRTSPVTTRAHCQWTDIAALAPELLVSVFRGISALTPRIPGLFTDTSGHIRFYTALFHLKM